MSLSFEIVAKDSRSEARAGLITTAHGQIETPVFMPVGTAGSVKAITQEMLEELDARIILGNTYHLYLRPGAELIKQLGGLHRFISWPRAILTDSGGYQVYSLGQLRKLTEEGAVFKSHLDGSEHLLSPEKAIEIQAALGSDIMMALDECTPHPATREQAKESMEWTTRWARRSRARFDQLRSNGVHSQSLFGIVQGSIYSDLRRESLNQIAEIGFDGYAIGGLGIGEEKQAMYDSIEFIAPLMPADRPRYLMGVGPPEDLVESVARGVDMFDCVVPTRNARNGQVFTARGKLNIRNARYSADERPLDESCRCMVCLRYSRAYIRHLHLSSEILSCILCSYHNLYFYLDTMKKLRHSILLGVFTDFRKRFLASYKDGEESSG